MKRTVLISLALAFTSSSTPVFPSSAGCCNLPLSVVANGTVSQNSTPVITPKGFGPIVLGMAKSDIQPRVEGLYDSYIYEQDEMGELGDCYQFKRGNQLVAEAFLDVDNRIYSIVVYVIGARTEDGKYEVGMSFSKAVAGNKFKLFVSEGPLIITAEGCPYSPVMNDYTEVLTPAAIQQVDRLYETRGEMLLTPELVQPSALLRAIAINSF